GAPDAGKPGRSCRTASSNHWRVDMNPDDSRVTLGAEGADPMTLAGINEANFTELQRALGVRVSQRGDAVTMIGTHAQLARAMPVVQGLIDLARTGRAIASEDVFRIATEGHVGELGTPGDTGRILLPGLRRAIMPKTPGQREYLGLIAEHDVVIGIGPAG